MPEFTDGIRRVWEREQHAVIAHLAGLRWEGDPDVDPSASEIKEACLWALKKIESVVHAKSSMTAREAMIYCLSEPIHPEVIDGERVSRSVYDRNGTPHWFAWNASNGDMAKPRMCAECFRVFSEACAPYTTEVHDEPGRSKQSG